MNQEKDKVLLQFADNTTVEGDFVIGADGINSQVRKQIFPKLPFRYSGQTCWRGLVTHTLPDQWKNATLELWGKQLRFGMAEMADEQIYWFAVKSAPENDIKEMDDVKQYLHDQFHLFKGPVHELIEATPDFMIRQTDLHDLPGLKKWHQSKICLIGDAAHAATPNLGQGGAQAVEDAYTLVKELQGSTQPELAFQRFQKKRYGKVKRIIFGSYWIGRVAHWKCFRGVRNFFLRNTPAFIEESQLNSIYRID